MDKMTIEQFQSEAGRQIISRVMVRKGIFPDWEILGMFWTMDKKSGCMVEGLVRFDQTSCGVNSAVISFPQRPFHPGERIVDKAIHGNFDVTGTNSTRIKECFMDTPPMVWLYLKEFEPIHMSLTDFRMGQFFRVAQIFLALKEHRSSGEWDALALAQTRIAGLLSAWDQRFQANVHSLANS